LSIQLTLILFWFGHGRTGSDAGLTAEAVYTGRYIAGRFVDLHSWLSVGVVLTNILPVVIGQGLSKMVLLVIPALSVRTLSWIHAVQLLAASSFQSLMIWIFPGEDDSRGQEQ
jgi:hypothetical protein